MGIGRSWWILLAITVLAGGCIAPSAALAQSCGGFSQPPCPPSGSGGTSAPGRYALLFNGAISVNLGAGSQSYNTGQFGFTPNFLLPPPVVLGQNPGLPGLNDIIRPFAAEQKSEIERRTDEAFSALGYADRKKKALTDSTTAAQPDRLWNTWVNVGGGGLKVNETSGSGNDAKGNQANVTVGVDRKIAPGAVIGISAAYESFNYNVNALGASTKYNGETVGVYFVQSSSNLSFDASLGWTNLNYNSAVGATGGSFIGSRWRAVTGLTGNYILNSFVLQPSARISMVWEHDSGWTDNVGNVMSDNNVSAGRTALGALVARPFAASGRWVILPYAGLYGDWSFSSHSNNALAGPSVAVINGGWSGRVTAGFAAKAVQGIVVSLGGELGGLGANYKIWTGNVRAAVPF